MEAVGAGDIVEAAAAGLVVQVDQLIELDGEYDVLDVAEIAKRVGMTYSMVASKASRTSSTPRPLPAGRSARIASRINGCATPAPRLSRLLKNPLATVV